MRCPARARARAPLRWSWPCAKILPMEPTRALYAELTDGFSRPVRADDLVYAAAELRPGLVPTREQVAAEREKLQKDKDGAEIAQGAFLGDVLADPECGRHLIETMLRPTSLALERLDEFRASGSVDLGQAAVVRQGNVGIVELRNPRHLNAEDDSTMAPF